MGRRIEVVAYDPNWVIAYHQEAKEISDIFSEELLFIHHIGSTSIPGIKAKPVIDILAVIRDIRRIREYDSGMIRLGYRPRGECLDAIVPGTPGRFYYSKDTNGVRSHQVHIVQEGHFEIQEKLAFRDYLRTFPEEAKIYSDLKEKLAENNRNDIVGYMKGKNDFIKSTITKALDWQQTVQNR